MMQHPTRSPRRALMTLTSALVLALCLALAPACGDSGGDGGAACEPSGDQCPNFCTEGTAVEGEACASSEDCMCGLFCNATAGACAPYEGTYAGCSCEATGDDTGGDTGDDTDDTGDTPGGDDTDDTGVEDFDEGCDKAAPVPSTCNPYCQKGCEIGEHCTFVGGIFGCHGFGLVGLGEQCGTSTDCVDGLSCFGLTNDPFDTCHQPCIGDTDCPGGRLCNLNVNFGNFTVSFCGDPVVGCDPFADSATECGAGAACYYGNQATKCLPAGSLGEGEICYGQASNACMAGLQCLVECQVPCQIGGTGDNSCNDCEIGFDEISVDNDLGLCIGNEPASMCDLFTQVGCGNGEGCYPVTGGIACVSAGAAAEGEPCLFTNSCVPGTICINGQCQKVCSVAEDAAAGTTCDELCEDNGNLAPAEWQIGFCQDATPAVPCNFWQQDCDDPTMNCYLVSNGATCLAPGGSGAAGAACQFVADCAPGLVCYQDMCREVCSLEPFNEDGAEYCLDACGGGTWTSVNTAEAVGVCDQ